MGFQLRYLFILRQRSSHQVKKYCNIWTFCILFKSDVAGCDLTPQNFQKCEIKVRRVIPYIAFPILNVYNNEANNLNERQNFKKIIRFIPNSSEFPYFITDFVT